MKIQPPVDEIKGNPLVGFAVFILLLLGAVFAASFFFYFKNTKATAPLILQNFAGKVEISTDGKKWQAPRRSSPLKPFTYLRTQASSEADLRFSENVILRLKENSSFFFLPPSVLSHSAGRIHLIKGNLLVANNKEPLEVSFSESKTSAPRSFFEDLSTKSITGNGEDLYLVSAEPEKKTVAIHVLRGALTVATLFKRSQTVVSEMESIVKSGTANLAVSKIAEKDWKAAQESYELITKSTQEEARQKDLAKKAGNFFNYVLDHGTFYQEKFGWCEREFFSAGDNSHAYMETTYDVFPTGAWVGVYMKTRDFDISKFKTFKLDARRTPGRHHPDFIRIEFKSKYQVIQAFAVKMIQTEWETIEFPLTISKPTPISEMTIIISNDKVGSNKTGGVQFKNFTVVDADKKPLALLAKPAAPKPLEKTDLLASKIAAVGQNASAITKTYLPAVIQKPLINKAAAPLAAAAKPAETEDEDLPDDFSDEDETF